MLGQSTTEAWVSSPFTLQYNTDATSLSVRLCQPLCVVSLRKKHTKEKSPSGGHVTVKHFTQLAAPDPREGERGCYISVLVLSRQSLLTPVLNTAM